LSKINRSELYFPARLEIRWASVAACDYRDSNAPLIKFQFLLRFKIVIRSRWIANNTGWHHALLYLFGGSAVAECGAKLLN
jgi:hypothetical protein